MLRQQTAVCKACNLGNTANPLPAGRSFATIHFNAEANAAIIVPHFKTCPLFSMEMATEDPLTNVSSSFWLPGQK